MASTRRLAHLLSLTLLGVVLLSGRIALALSVQDDVGHTVVFEQPPTRIVSLSPGLTEILFALGLDDQVVGVSDFCDYPPAARAKPKVGGVIPNLEAIVALRPDLVVGTGGVAMSDFVRRLERLRIPAMGLESASIEAVFSRILLLGTMTARERAAAELVASLRDRLQAMPRAWTDRVPRVLYLVEEEPYMTVGPGSFLYDVIVKAGGRPMAGAPNETYPRIGLEAILRFDPEVMLFADDSDAGMAPRVARWARWRTISAVRNGRLYGIPRDFVNRPGPRVVDAVEFVAKTLQRAAAIPP